MAPSERAPVFPSTRWSRILSPGGERDLEQLARDYCRPIEAWLAARFGRSRDEAHELMQEAFAWLLASRLLDRADPARGRFRGLLKTALANFVVERQRAARADKRGGNHVHVSLADAAEVVDPNGRPDELLDAAWRRELLEGAQAELQRELENSGRAAYWRVFHDWFLHEEPGVDLDHRTLARRHGITPVDVANWLAFAKQRYREILRQRVADTVQSPADLDAELHWLFGKEAR